MSPVKTIKLILYAMLIFDFVTKIIEPEPDNRRKCKDSNDSRHRCICDVGFTPKETYCEDINECTTKRANCSVNSHCINTIGSYTCRCKEGYSGDSESCTDIDECKADSHNCDKNAHCINKDGSHICTCNSGYTGDGNTCHDINECQLNCADVGICTSIHNCSHHAQCANTIGNYTCTCKPGYHGDGKICTSAGARVSQEIVKLIMLVILIMAAIELGFIIS